MSEFLILSRPRARSAWMSAFFSNTPQALCFHEELPAAAGSVAQLKARMDNAKRAAGVQAIGCADTGFIHSIGEIDAHFPDAQCCLIIGNEDRFRRFAKRAGLSPEIVRMIDRAHTDALAWCEDTPRCMKLHVDGMNHGPVMAATWEHLTGAAGFNAERWELFRRLYIVQPADQIRERATAEFRDLLTGVPLPNDIPTT